MKGRAQIETICLNRGLILFPSAAVITWKSKRSYSPSGVSTPEGHLRSTLTSAGQGAIPYAVPSLQGPSCNTLASTSLSYTSHRLFSAYVQKLGPLFLLGRSLRFSNSGALEGSALHGISPISMAASGLP